MKINVLPTEIANMIAAGEVVERPASVVKELTENCIDAGATSITVEIKKGGVPYIRVTDNGCGIERGEIATAFLPHATSKIKTASDLDTIGTLGFRGEALASIAAVSSVEIFTKTREEAVGSCVTVEAGKVIEEDEAGCPDGTTIIVRNLFFNTPARMKFLKSDSAETAHITDIMSKLILSHPEISFQYISGGKKVLSSPGDGKLLSAVYSVFGKEYTDNMTKVDFSEDGFTVTGYVGNGKIARGDRRHQIFFVNSRNIISKVMSAAVSEAFKTTVTVGKFPVCVIKLETDSRNVDVNVHPAKTEVRFTDERKVYSGVYWGVKNALTENKYIPSVEIKTKQDAFSKVKNAPSYEEAKQINLLKDYYVETPKKEEKKEEIKVSPQKTETDTERFARAEEKESNTERFTRTEEPKKESYTERFTHIDVPKPESVSKKIIQDYKNNLRPITEEEAEKIMAPKPPLPVEGVDFKYIGQIFGTYAILQKDNEMLLIDQHAAHERICYEELLEKFRHSLVDSQLMLLPVTVTLSATEVNTAEENIGFFSHLGFEAEIFGTNALIIRATPGTMEEQDIRDCVTEIIGLISQNVDNLKYAVYEKALHMIACKKALKGNRVLSDTELKVLCAKVLQLGDGINTCPHGRPIMISMTKYAVEKQFKRE